MGWQLTWRRLQTLTAVFNIFNHFPGGMPYFFGRIARGVSHCFGDISGGMANGATSLFDTGARR
tara:strand:- start:3884 stop:4075 length:192 start_codon:yes stop_codon:yes gene_type:complete